MFIALLFASLLLFVTPAQAANCGGSIPCACGDTVTTHYVMPAALACPTGHGLRVGSGVTLNCNGNNLYGAGLPETYGIYLSGTTGAYVVNCNTYYWDRGIRLNNAHRNTLQTISTAVNGNQTLHTGYGIDLAGGSSSNYFLQVNAIANYDEGVHVGTGANENIFYQGEYCGNFRENLYFLANRDNTVHSASIGHSCYGYTSGSNSVYVKDGTHNHFLFNQIRERQFHVTGNSNGTVLFQNQFIGTIYKESCYAPTGRSRPPRVRDIANS
jgi:hypothetical protein